MVDAQHAHVGAAARAALLDRLGRDVEHLHERDRAGGGAAVERRGRPRAASARTRSRCRRRSSGFSAAQLTASNTPVVESSTGTTKHAASWPSGRPAFMRVGEFGRNSRPPSSARSARARRRPRRRCSRAPSLGARDVTGDPAGTAAPASPRRPRPRGRDSGRAGPASAFSVSVAGSSDRTTPPRERATSPIGAARCSRSAVRRAPRRPRGCASPPPRPSRAVDVRRRRRAVAAVSDDGELPSRRRSRPRAVRRRPSIDPAALGGWSRRACRGRAYRRSRPRPELAKAVSTRGTGSVVSVRGRRCGVAAMSTIRRWGTSRRST